MNIAIVGQGYVGLTAAACLAESGHTVVGIESDRDRLEVLRSGRSPIYEPGLQDLLDRVLAHRALRFEETPDSIAHPTDAVIIAVGTPPLPSDEPDLTQVWTALRQVKTMRPAPDLVVVKSTVPPGTSVNWLAGEGESMAGSYVYAPEFLSQGSALHDWRSPSRIIAGITHQELIAPLRELLHGITAPWVITDPTSAETAKYASNAFLATKISFANEMANFCEQVGASIDDVIESVGLDPRIGADFLCPGIGYGDSCLPKDTRALSYSSQLNGTAMPLLRAVIEVNEAQRIRVIRLLREHLTPILAARPLVAVLGLAYEPVSDDMRYAPSRMVIPELKALGVNVRIWDPAMPQTAIDQVFPSTERAVDIETAVNGAAVVLVLTQWPQITHADWAQLAPSMVEPRMIIDAKNFLNPRDLLAHGLRYRGIGRPTYSTGVDAHRPATQDLT